MDRRVILVDFAWTRPKDPRAPLGHASLLAALRSQTQASVASLVVPVNTGNTNDTCSRVLDAARGWSSDRVDVAIGAYVWAEHEVRETLAGLRSRGFKGRIILGGPQVSYTGPGLEALYPGADLFVRGEGEEALCRLAFGVSPDAIDGIHCAGAEDTCSVAIPNSEYLVSPYLTGLIPLEGQAFVRWETQRGCPFQCAYCQHRRPDARRVRRDYAWARLEREIALFCDHGVTDIAVLDPIFHVSPHATQILEAFRRHGYRGRLSLQCRVELCQPEFLDALEGLDVRLEFGLQTIHPAECAAINRRNDLPRVEAVLDEVRGRGISHEVSLIYGLPEQTLTSFLKTVDWCLRRRVPAIKAFPLMLLRGTGLDRDRDHWDLREDGAALPAVLSSSTFDAMDRDAMRCIAEALQRTEGQHPQNIHGLLRTTQAA